MPKHFYKSYRSIHYVPGRNLLGFFFIRADIFQFTFGMDEGSILQITSYIIRRSYLCWTLEFMTNPADVMMDDDSQWDLLIRWSTSMQWDASYDAPLMFDRVVSRLFDLVRPNSSCPLGFVIS